MCVCVCVRARAHVRTRAHAELLSCVQLFATTWTVAHQVPLSMGFSRQEYWSGLPFLSPGDLPNSGIEPRSTYIPGGFFTIWATRESLSPYIASAILRVGAKGLEPSWRGLFMKKLWWNCHKVQKSWYRVRRAEFCSFVCRYSGSTMESLRTWTLRQTTWV